MKYTNKQINEFLKESNAIEQVYSKQALADAHKAWSYLKEKQFLTPEVILATHNFLGRNIEPEIAGKWRDCDVYIGGKRKIFISTYLIEENVKNFCDNLTKSLTITEDLSTEEKERICKDLHVEFEELHPFQDINGRTGRCIYLWHRMKIGLPIHIIHADWHKEDGEQRSYYKWFRE